MTVYKRRRFIYIIGIGHKIKRFIHHIEKGKMLMTREGILNPELCRAVAACGHTDRFVIADCGLPVPDGVRVIDLSLVRGVPGFLQTLEAVLGQLVVEACVLADEMETFSPQLRRETLALLGGLPCESVPHEKLKELTAGAKVVVRTGEATPYANVVLMCGTNF